MRLQYNAAICNLGARDWTKSLLDTLPSADLRYNDRRRNNNSNTASTDVVDGSHDAVGETKMKYGARGGWNAERSNVVAEVPDNDWCRDSRDKGKRVVIKGLPGQIDQRYVRILAEDCGVEQGHGGRLEGDDVKRLPP
jgi:hypothetical protein